MVSDRENSSARESRSRSNSPQSKMTPGQSPLSKLNKDESQEQKKLNNELETNRPVSRSGSHSSLAKSKSRSVSSKSRSRSRSRRRHRSYSRGRESHKRRRRSRSRSSRRSRSRDRRDRRSRRDSSRDKYRRRHSRSYSRSRTPSPHYRRLNPSPCRVIGVFGLSYHTDERNLKRVFEKYGRVDKIKLVTDPRTGRSRGFAFVYMENVDDAEEAKDRVHGIDIDGNYVRCEYSISNREHNPTPGIYMGRRTGRYGDRSRSRTRSRSRSIHERRRRSYSNDRY